MEDKDVSHLQILPKALVHKDGFDDIFLTSFAIRGPRESVLGATLPRSHGFYCELPVSRRMPDLATLIEICRQACFVVAHEQFDVPLGGPTDAKFLMKELSGEFVDTSPFETDGGYRATVRGDLRHPVMFDHPADYIFAMVQLEASRQLALFAAARRLGLPATDLEMCGVTAEYLAVAEFDLPTVLSARFSET